MPQHNGSGQTNRRSFLKAAGSASAAAFIAGCTGGDGSNQTTTTTATGDDTQTTEDEATQTENNTQSSGGSLTVGMGTNEIQTLDPAMIDVEDSIQVASNIYNALLKYDESMKVTADLATAWAWNSETEVQFKLRDGVTFHNGEEMTAADVKFSLERVLDKETGSPWREKLSVISAVKTPDPQTVVLELEEPYAPLESYLVRRNMGGCVVPKDAVESGTNLATNPIGTGPFKLANWQQGSKLELTKFGNFWEDGQPKLDSITLQLIPDTTTLVTALEAGDVDLINNVPNQALSRLKQKSAISLYDSDGLNVRYIGFNTRDGNAFANPKVRQAASLAISRKNMVSVLGSEVYKPNPTPVPQALSWAVPDSVPNQSQNVEKAKQLLQEANADGTSISIKVWKGQSWKKIANVARDMLNEVGFNAEVKVFEFGTFWDQVTKNNDFDAFVLGWTGLTDPDAFLYSQFHTGGSWNWMDYSNQQVDNLLEKGRATTDRSARTDAYFQAQKKICQDAVYANIATQRLYQASQNYVSGYTLLPTSSLRLKNVSVDK